MTETMPHNSNARSVTGLAQRISILKHYKLALPVTLFLISLVLPFIIQIGSFRFSVYRTILLLMTFPLLYLWLSGKAGRIRLADIALFLFCLWAALSFAIVNGPSVGIEAGGIFFVETMGAYLLARCFIRDTRAFRSLTNLLVLLVLLLLPFAAVEALTGRNILLEFMDSIWPSYRRVAKDPRWGLQRVQATFEHPILYGVFCGSIIGLTYMVWGYGRSLFRRTTQTLLIFATAGFTLSSGPLAGMVAQFMLIFWNGIFSRFAWRWKLFIVLVAITYLGIELTSNRSAAAIFIQYFSFNEFSAYMRIHIWNFGTDSILQHPLIGIGFNDWERPGWMSSSIDMFWIVSGVRHGLPASFLFGLGFISIFVSLMLRKGLSPVQNSCRHGILFCLTGFFLSGWTVHFWNATYVLFMFMLGSGVWLLDAKPENPEQGDTEPEETKPGFQYTRFPVKPAASQRSDVKPGTKAALR